MKKALITGITGQDGAYLSKQLLEKGYEVHAGYRRLSTPNFWRAEELGILGHENLHLRPMDLTDQGSVFEAVMRSEPDEIYNLAAQSHVGKSFKEPSSTHQITGGGALHLLEAIRLIAPSAKYYQASTSEMYGGVSGEVMLSEETPFHPRSPYGVAKLYAHWLTVNYRESYDIFGTCGILFNHESPLRGVEFVTRKITDGLARVHLGLSEHLELGNLDAKRDWGFAGDYTEGMWMMLQQEKPDDFVLATGRTETIRSFVELSARALGMQISWEGSGLDEVGVDEKSGKSIVKINENFYRPAEVDILLGDSTKAEKEIGWKPSTTLEELAIMMVDADLRRLKK